MVTMEVSKDLLSKNIFPYPLNLPWRITHFLLYFTGGLFFMAGSTMYFPDVNNLVVGGWLFTLGSLCLTAADSMEWWTNNRVGCFKYADYEEDYESKVGYLFPPAQSAEGSKLRAANGKIFFWSACGSFLYFIGSIFLIPSTHAFLLGDLIYVFASLLIMICQTVKVYRMGIDFGGKEAYAKGFDIANWLRDIGGLGVDISEGIGALCYLVGTLLFFPETDIDSTITYLSAGWFQAGGVFYTVAGFFLAYRYFWTTSYPPYTLF